MNSFGIGSRVRIDIPDERDPDFNWHGEHGVVIELIEDDAGISTGDDRDRIIYRVALDDHGVTVDVRWRDLRPPLEDKD